MKVLEEKLNKLCINYKTHILHEVHEKILEWWNAIPNDKKVAIRGGGLHTVELFNIVPYWEKNIIGIFDNNKQMEDMLPYTIHDTDDIINFDIDIIILSSYEFRYEMKEHIVNIGLTATCLDLYKELRDKHNKLFTGAFHQKYLLDECSMLGSIYEKDKSLRYIKELYYAREKYKTSINDQESIYCLKILISHYIRLRDFSNMSFFLNEYVKNKYKNWENYKCFGKEINKLLQEVKERIHSRAYSKQTILLILIDALNYNMVNDIKTYQMFFLNQLKEKSMSFENCYTHTYFTTDSIKSFITQNELFSDGYEDIGSMHSVNSKLIKELEDNGYKIKSTGLYNVFGKKNEKRHYGINVIMWEAICDLYQNDEPTFYFIHELGEIHDPTMCGYHTKVPKYCETPIPLSMYPDDADYQENLVDCCKYVDKGLEQYFEFLPDTTSKFILADHGQPDGNVAEWKSYKLWCDAKLHVPLIIQSPFVEPKTEEGMTTLLDLASFIIDIISQKKPIIYYREFVTAQFNLIYKTNALIWFRKVFGENLYVPCRIYISNSDKYVITYAGQEFYYLKDDDETNRMDQEEYRGRILYIKTNMDISFPDFKHPKFNEARKFYFDEQDKPTLYLL